MIRVCGVEAALKLAAESLLTENGPPVKKLPEAKLAEMARPGGR